MSECECDMCCILAIERVDECDLLYWQCNCPGGTATLQRRPPPGIGTADWSTVPNFNPNVNFYWPYFPFGNVGGVPSFEYRVRCVLADGQTYFSNIVGNPSRALTCRCGPLGEWVPGSTVDYSVRPFTRASANAPRVFTGPAVFRQASVGCGQPGVELHRTTVTGFFNTEDILNFTGNGYAAGLQLFGSNASFSAAVQPPPRAGTRCHWECPNLFEAWNNAHGSSLLIEMRKVVTDNFPILFPQFYTSEGDLVEILSVYTELQPF